MAQFTFEDARQAYYHGDKVDTDKLLLDCVTAATTVDELVWVFQTTFDEGPSRGVRSAALTKAVELSRTAADARRVYPLATRRLKGRTRYVWPKVAKLAEEKLTPLLA